MLAREIAPMIFSIGLFQIGTTIIGANDEGLLG